MGSYVPNTLEEQQRMLEEAGFKGFEELFAQIPEEVKVHGGLHIPEGLSELGVCRHMTALAEKNRIFAHVFRGAGAYRHYIPSIVKSVVSKEEFITAYTPYQAEVSQGILQSIFEFQSMICELTGMEAANASVYDGATAAAEAISMCKDRKRTTAYVSAAVHPDTIRVMETYCFGTDTELVVVPEKNGVTDLDALREKLNEKAACVYFQQPNYYGRIEPAEELVQVIHDAGAKAVMGCNPISLAVLKTPGEYGADVAVGEGQPLGLELAFGGPYLGFMAASQSMFRKLPGRIVGETKDVDGKRAFVLTLQAREQHIRREKASSNICSNQALCALTAAVYMSAMGKTGMEEAARQCAAKAHYLQNELIDAGLNSKFEGEFFHEFVTVGETDSAVILKALEEKGILGGLPLNEKEILWCATEMNTKEEIDELVKAVKEVCGR